jgi:glycosyltransferase involved in cell wall biosynthesis
LELLVINRKTVLVTRSVRVIEIMDSPHVCFVVNSVNETSVPADIARALVKYTDCDVDILAWFNATPFQGDDSVGVSCLEAPETTLGVDMATISRARQILSEYDLVQAHHNHSGGFAKLLAGSVKVPTVSREGNLRRGFTRKGRVFNGLTNALAARVVPNSVAVRDDFKRWERLLLSEEAIKKIPNGVDAERLAAGKSLDWDIRSIYDIDADATLISNAALLTEQKAHDVLITGLKQATERTGERLELAIAGDGPQESALRSLAERAGVAEQVHFLGRIERRKVYRLMDESDLYAMPSRWEGFSAAAVEAMGVGVACVFSDIRPFRIPYEDVALFHPVDEPEHLADRLVTLAERPDLREELATEGRSLVEEYYTMESVARQYRELYDEILD